VFKDRIYDGLPTIIDKLEGTNVMFVGAMEDTSVAVIEHRGEASKLLMVHSLCLSHVKCRDIHVGTDWRG
jgi:hypothetical protein